MPLARTACFGLVEHCQALDSAATVDDFARSLPVDDPRRRRPDITLAQEVLGGTRTFRFVLAVQDNTAAANKTATFGFSWETRTS